MVEDQTELSHEDEWKKFIWRESMFQIVNILIFFFFKEMRMSKAKGICLAW